MKKTPVVIAAGLVALALIPVSPALAQSKFIKEANTKYFLGSAGENDAALLTALNLCDVPIHVRMTLIDGATGNDVATAWEGDLAAGRTTHLDAVLGAPSGGLAHRLVATVEATLPTAVTAVPDCMKGKAVAVSAQFEIVKPGGPSMLLPAVQKVR